MFGRGGMGSMMDDMMQQQQQMMGQMQQMMGGAFDDPFFQGSPARGMLGDRSSDRDGGDRGGRQVGRKGGSGPTGPADMFGGMLGVPRAVASAV